MKFFAVLILIAFVQHSCAQQENELLKKYFLGIPITGSYPIMLEHVSNSSNFKIDSSIENKGVYATFQKRVEFAEGSFKIRALINWGVNYQTKPSINSNGGTNEITIADTVKSALVTYYFNKEKNQSRLYKKIVKDFLGVLSYAEYEKHNSEEIEWEETILKAGENDLYPRLILYKGNHSSKGLYVSAFYELR